MMQRFLAPIFLILLLTGGAHAQSIIRYAEPGYVTMAINLWGDVNVPGRYEVPQDIDLVDLLTLAGGPRGYASPVEYRVARVDIKISRLFPNGRRIFFQSDLEEVIRGEKYPPPLQNEDVILVKVEMKRKGINWQNISIAVTTLTSIVILGLNLRNIL